MSRDYQAGQQWGKSLLLGMSVVLATGSGSAFIQPQAVHAATAQQSAVVYNQFQRYVKNPAKLAKARSYLINHIKEAGIWNATLMTLHLENAQKAQLPIFAEKLYSAKAQKVIDAAARKKGLTYSGLLSVITDSSIRTLLMSARDQGYKIESSEGMYYPVMHYEGFKVFKPYVTKDIADYIDIMAAESNQPMAFDGAIVIGWNQVISRALAKEAFVQKYPGSNRKKAVQLDLAWSRVFFGASNTPAYDNDGAGQPSKLNPKLRAAYEAAVKNGPANSKLLQTIQQLLSLLDTTGNVLTPEVQRFLDEHVK